MSSDWYGAHPGGELHVPVHPRAVLERVHREVDELHAWHGGGVAFGRKPFLGEVRRATFRVRPLSFRRDGAVGFLVAEVEPAQNGSTVRYRIESPVGFVRTLPVAALAPAALFGIGGYLASPALAPGEGLTQIAFVAASSLVGLLTAIPIVALVLHGIRKDTSRLLGFLATTLDVEPSRVDHEKLRGIPCR